MRKWIKGMSPRQLNSLMPIYKGIWMPQMDRCWISDDGYSVMSRLVRTKWGKVEHVTIQNKKVFLSSDGSGDIPWAIKQEIKDELFGKNRLAIEVFPTENLLVDVCNVYHLWVFEKGFELPFGIHPREAAKMEYVNRGFSFTEADLAEYKKLEEKYKLESE